MSEEKNQSADTVHEILTQYPGQDAWGNDIGLLRLNLKRTPLERLRGLQDMYDFVQKYKGAVNRKP